MIAVVDYKLIGQRIQEQRRKCGLRQEFVAEQADITVVYLSKIENGRAKPTIEAYSAICEVLQCDLSTIFSDVATTSRDYQNERVTELFRACSPEVKPIALDLLEKLSKLK